MNIEEFNYIWTEKKEDYVLVNTEFGYGIVNKRKQTVLSISDEAIEDAVISRMQQEGNKKYNNIQEAYADV